MANPILFSDLFLLNAQDAEVLLGVASAIKGLSGSYKQFAKNLDSDGQKVAGALAALTTQTAALKQQMGNVNIASDQERAGYAALSASLAQLYRDQQNLLASEKGIDSTRKATTESTRVLTSELRKQQQALKDAYAAGNTEGVRLAAAEILKLKANSEDLNRALRGANSIYTAAAGSYRAMENEARALGTQLKNLEGSMGSNADEVRDLQKRLGEVNAAIISFGRGINDGHANVGRYAESIIEAVGSLERQRRALLAGAEALRTQAQATNLSREQQDKLQAELAQTDVQLSRVNGELRNYGVGVVQANGGTSTLSAGAGQLVQTFAGAYYGIQGVATALQQVFESNIQYSDSAADVAKTTGLSSQAVNELAEHLKKLDTRTSLQGLLDIAVVGGQLGVAGENIEDFVKVIDVSVQALGNDFKGGASEIAESLGKINTVFGQQLGGDLSENLLHIGSALNQLGAVGAATAPQLADVALRTGAVAANAGLGLDKVLSYAAVLEEVGVSAETSGSALNRLFSTISTKTKASFDIAKLGNANLTLKEFKRLVNTDFEGAIQAFLKGLNAGGTTTTRMNALLATLKLQSGEAKSAIVTLAGNLDLYSQRQAVANEELKTGNSVATEAAIKTDNLAGSWEKLKNRIVGAVTEGRVATFFKAIIDFANGGILYQEKLQKTLGQTVDKTVAAGLASRGLATDVQDLLATYDGLTSTTTRSAAEQQKLNTTVLALKDRLGDSVVTIDKQTGAYTLNTAAVQAAIIKQHELADAQAVTLAKRLQGLNEQRAAAKAAEEALSQSTDTRSKQLVSEITPEQMARVERYLTLAKEGSEYEAKASLTGLGKAGDNHITPEQVEQVKALEAETQKLAAAGLKLEAIDRDRAVLLAGLKKLGLDEASALAIITATTAKKTKAGLDDIDVDKKKKQSIADVAKEEYELQKQRLQARIADLDRQADNPANTESIRNSAISKGVEVRKQLAALERDELIREATQANKDKINGDAATATARVRLQEAFQNELLKVNREGDAKQLALRNMLLNQLGELDKLLLETEITAAEKVRDDVNKTYDERQKAARETAHAQIELAALVRDAEIRNAQGALDKIELANQKYEAARATASKSVKVYDSQKDIDEQDASYARQLLALESLHGKKLVSEKNYQHQVRDLENQREAEAIASLEAEYGETAEVLKRKAALRKKMGEEELADEREKTQALLQIIQDGLGATQTLSDAFFQLGNDRRAADLENARGQYDNDLKVAGNNLALKEKAEKDYAKRELEIKRKQAQADKEQALFNVALRTAQAVVSVLSTGGGTYYADFGISAGVLSALVIAQGVAQAAVIAAKPLPNYFKGRADGPAEFANLAERGPELVGRPGAYRLIEKPTVGFLQAGERVYTAPETSQILAENQLIEGRITQRRESADMQQQAALLREGTAQHHLAQQRAAAQSNSQVLAELRQVRKAIQEQEYYRLNEQDDLVRRVHQENGYRDMVNRRYKRGRGTTQ